jgi:hypothetical protein
VYEIIIGNKKEKLAMFKQNTLLHILIMITAITAAANTQSDFIRRIDRPLQDRKGTHRISFGVAGEKRLHYDTLSVRLSSGYSFAVTDKITFCAFPWPLLQMQIKSASIDSSTKNAWKSTALSLRFGTTSTLGLSQLLTQYGRAYSDDYIRVFPQIDLLLKTCLQNMFWIQYDMMLSSVSNEAFQGFIYPRACFQITNHIYGMVGCRAGFFKFSNEVPVRSRISYLYRYGYSLDFFNSSNARLPYIKKSTRSASIPVELGFDSGNHFSAVISTSIGKKVSKFIPLQLQCNLEW